MSNFRKWTIGLIAAELVIFLAFNLLYVLGEKDVGRFYRVEAERITLLLSQNAEYGEHPEKLDLSAYRTIKAVGFFDASGICRRDYLVSEVGGKLYRIEYEAPKDTKGLLFMNLGFLAAFLITAAVFYKIYRSVIRPFGAMTDMTYELAKGNLTMPMKEEKSRFFGRFLWGIDMLRENLEGSKKRELTYQKEKKSMLTSLAHDIKTPLSAITLYAKALKEDIYDTQEERIQALDGISARTEEIKGYVNEIYRLSKEDFMELSVKQGEFYLSEVISKVEAYYREKLGLLHTEFCMEEPENCLLFGDADRLTEALQNLMENAIKYGDGKKISLSFLEEEDCKLITVKNTGCTLEEKELPNIFDSFYRGSNTAGTEGNGLGLYIVRTLMKKMDGDVFAKAADGCFEVTLVVRKA